MKKTFLILLLAGFSTVLQAGSVTPEKALKVAERVLSASSTKAAGSLHIIWDGETATTKADTEAPAFYVVGRDGGGFVIVAGNDNVRPVLALSYDNKFAVEGMPENVRWWMERIKEYSRTAPEATPEVKAQWEAFEETKSLIYPEAGIHDEFLKSRTVQWNQDSPANLFSPKVKIGNVDYQAVCGCVPLAVSEIMTWFGWPEKGHGKADSYRYGFRYNNNQTVNVEMPENDLTIPEYELEQGTTFSYLWEGLQALKLPEDFDAHASADDDLGKNLGQLLFDVGTLLQVQYGVSTGGDLELLVSELCDHMDYSKKAIERRITDGYSMIQWDQMLKEEVTLHPLYYGGYSYSSPANPNVGTGGHAYVLDGYATYTSQNHSEQVFHFNFGWGGTCNGYYSSDYQHVVIKEGREYNFDTYMSALFGFTPDYKGTTSPECELVYKPEGGIRQTSNGNSLKVYANYVLNVSLCTFEGIVALFRLNKEGVRGQTPLGTIELSGGSDLPPGYNYRAGEDGVWFSIGKPSDVQLGDKLAFYYKPEGEVEYKKIGLVNPSVGIDELALMPAAFIKTKANYSVNEYFYFRLTNHDSSYENAQWTITDPLKITETYLQEVDRIQLTQPGKYTIKVTPVEGGETIVTVINVK